MKITFSKGGTKERKVKVSDIQIPDLWHIAIYLKEIARRPGHSVLAEHADSILEVWHMAHDMKKALQSKS